MVTNQEEEINRDRGLLSPSDRKFLLSNNEERQEKYSQPAQHKRHQALSTRLGNGLQDLSLLADRLETEDRDRVLEEFSRPALRRGAVGAIAMTYELSYIDNWDFSDLFFEGINRAYTTRRKGIPVESVKKAVPIIETEEFQSKRDTIETAKERFLAGERLTDHEIAMLIRYADIETKQIIQRVRENEREHGKEKATQKMTEQLNRELSLAEKDTKDKDGNEYNTISFISEEV